jgi:lysophospholipase L1-like esterase
MNHRGRAPMGRWRRVFMLLFFAWAGASLARCAGTSLRERGGPPPEVRTLPASAITTDRATLNGTVDPNGAAAEAWFEIGTDPVPSNWTVTSRQSAGAGTTPRPVRGVLQGLKPYTTYYYRAAARNDSGEGKGEVATFPTGEYYVAVGDSITAGSTGINFESRLSDLLAGARGYPNVVANVGVSGATAAVGVDTISFALSTYPWATTYLVMFGTNDAFRPTPVPSGRGRHPGELGYSGSYKESLRKIIDAVRAAGKTPCLAKVPFASRSIVDPSSVREYNAVIDELVAEERLDTPPPDFFAYFHAHPDELADGIHPNRAGYDAMARLWLRALDSVRPR